MPEISQQKPEKPLETVTERKTEKSQYSTIVLSVEEVLQNIKKQKLKFQKKIKLQLSNMCQKQQLYLVEKVLYKDQKVLRLSKYP